MADPVHVTDAFGSYWYINSDKVADRLSNSQMEENVTYIYNYIVSHYPTWTKSAIAAMCGNSESEGVLNPSQWQYGGGMKPGSGYGLFQWTPSTKYIQWAGDLHYDRTWMYAQIIRIEYERANRIQYYKTKDYPISFNDFLTGDYTPEYLAKAWLYNYERPADPAASEATRVARSKKWYEFIGGQPGPGPGPGPSPGPPGPRGSSRFKFYLWPSFRR